MAMAKTFLLKKVITVAQWLKAQAISTATASATMRQKMVETGSGCLR